MASALAASVGRNNSSAKWPRSRAPQSAVSHLRVERRGLAPIDEWLTPYGMSWAARLQELVDDLWRLTLCNLDAHVRGGAGVVLPDFTDPQPQIRLSVVINAPREIVFKALTDPVDRVGRGRRSACRRVTAA